MQYWGGEFTVSVNSAKGNEVGRVRLRGGPTLLVVLGVTALVVLGAAALAAAAILGGPVSADSTRAAQRDTMSAVTQIDCDGTTRAGSPTQSVATISLNGKKVVAEVSLKGAVPNEQYQVVLTQSARQASCGGDQAVLITDVAGNASVKISAPRIDGRKGAFVSAYGPGPILVSKTFDYPN
jgi:hypothetical protein